MQTFDITFIELFQISCFFNFSTTFPLQSHFVKNPDAKDECLNSIQEAQMTA